MSILIILQWNRIDEDDDKPVDAKGNADITIQGNILKVDRTGKLNWTELLKQCKYLTWVKEFNEQLFFFLLNNELTLSLLNTNKNIKNII